MEGTPVSRESQEEQTWTAFVVRVFFDDLGAAHCVFNLISPNIASEYSSRGMPGDFVMCRPEGTTDLFQEFSIIGHGSHHSRDEHHIRATLLPRRSRVRSTVAAPRDSS